MFKLDRIVALVILVFCIGYAWQAWHYDLLPFEQRMPFKPNTMPLGLAVFGIVLSVAILFSKPSADDSQVAESAASSSAKKQYDKVRPIIFIGLMVAYALCLRPLGFVISTSIFLTTGALVLGERKLYILLPVAVGGAMGIWYIVHELLGIYMNPWPVWLD